MAFCLSVLGAVAWQTMRYDEAIELLERGLELTRAIPFPGGMSPLVDHLGDIARERGEFTRALDYYRQALPFWIESQDPHGAADSLAGFAAALEGLQQPETATTLLAAAAAYERLGFPRSCHSKALNEDTMARLREILGQERYEIAWQNGHSMPLDTALRAALDVQLTEMPVATAVPSPVSMLPVDESGLKQFGLTRREIEILQCLYEGRTKAEIGEALSISPRTAGTHIANIYGKLGVSSRAAAVATVQRAGGGPSN
jgi:DNA-binding CsgD family transcriptional regulator